MESNELEILMRNNPEIKIVCRKVELSFDGQLFRVENTALKIKTITQGISFESAVQSFRNEIEK